MVRPMPDTVNMPRGSVARSADGWRQWALDVIGRTDLAIVSGWVEPSISGHRAPREGGDCDVEYAEKSRIAGI